MLMPLLAPASGVVTFMLPEGAVMGAGDQIGRLELDDPNAVVGGGDGGDGCGPVRGPGQWVHSGESGVRGQTG